MAAGRAGAGAPERPYELVVFGASGFTGQFVVEEVARAAAGGQLRGALRWAVAGRSREKLRAVLERAAERLGKAALGAEVGVLLCDVGDAASLAAMARQTRLVLNCVGPYRFFGEPVVEACVENGASCIDVSGEPQFLEGMYLKYNEKAAEKGVYVIGSCGFDSIPADMGVLYTRDKLKGDLVKCDLMQKKNQMMLSSGFLKQQRLCGNSFCLSFCLPVPADRFQPNLVDKNVKVNRIPIRLAKIGLEVEEGFKVALLTERREPPVVSSGLLSWRVDVPRQA